MSTVVTSMFTWPLGEDVALLPQTVAISDAYHDLLAANHERIARWDPYATEPPTREGTRSFLEARGQGWLAGTELPVVIAVPADGGWQLAGFAGLRISQLSGTADAGYWIDSSFEGRGLVTRAVTALLDQAFGSLGLARVTVHTLVDNERSRAVATRLGFTEEGIHRQAVPFRDGRADEVIYGLLADEWKAARTGSA